MKDVQYLFDLWSIDVDFSIAGIHTLESTWRETILHQGQLILEKTFVFQGHWEMEKTHKPVKFDHSILWDYIPEDDPEWVYAFNRHSFLPVLAWCYQLTQDEKYVMAYRELVEHWIDNVPRTLETISTTWRSIECGIRFENWLRSLALIRLSPLIDGFFIQKMVFSLEDQYQWILEQDNAFHQMSNWGILENHGAFLYGVFLQDKKIQDIALSRLTQALQVQVFRDGTHWEQSPLYHGEVLHCCLDTLLVAKYHHIKIPSLFTTKVEALSHALSRLVRPDGYLLCQSDSDEVDARNLLALAAYLFNDSWLKKASYGLSPLNYFDFNPVAVEKYKEIPLDTADFSSYALRDSGNIMLWGKPENQSTTMANFLHFHCGSIGSGHGHGDLLHVDLVSNAESVFIDSGRYTYVECDLRSYLKSPQAHNTSRVDQVDFTLYRNTWQYSAIAKPLKGELYFSSQVDYIEGLHLGYLSKGVLPQRRIWRIDSDIWVIWDTFYPCPQGTKKEDSSPLPSHTYEINLHFGSTIAILPQNQTAQDRMTNLGHSLGNQNAESTNISMSNYTFGYEGQKAKGEMVVLGQNLQYTFSHQPMSREYNLLEESPSLRFYNQISGQTSIITVVTTWAKDKPAAEALKVEKMPVSLALTQAVLRDTQAESIKIQMHQRIYYLVVCHEEVISSVDMIEVEGIRGYGKILLASKDSKIFQSLIY